MTDCKFKKMLFYARADALAIGAHTLPDSSSYRALADFMDFAGDTLFIHGDPNHDNSKRNISIEVFLKFNLNEIVAFGLSWLEKWKKNRNQPWYIEWAAIFERADCDEIADILLSHDDERTRQRSSSPLGEMLDFNVILSIKRRHGYGEA